MARRYKSATLQLSKPLALPTSTRVEHCYACHGKGFAQSPLEGAALELVLINAERETRAVVGWCERRHALMTDQLPAGDDWRILGWRMCDGSLRLGEFDAVDPELAQSQFLGGANPPEHVWPR